MQDRFAVKLFTAAKTMGIHTALDTNGYFGSRLDDGELQAVDLVLLDIKTWDAERHRRLTGMDNGPVLAFGRRLAERRRPIWLRYVLVPGLTDDLDDIAQTAAYAAGLGTVERVDVLPFHQMGCFKWERLGLEYALHDVAPPTQALVDRVIDVFRTTGLTTY
jgi:pyruvate formate lyase activating enzyme